MGTPMHKAQAVIRTCSDHQHQEHSYFCKTCKKFVCTACVKTDHKDHDWDIVSSVAKEYRKETPKRCREIKIKLPHYKDAFDCQRSATNEEDRKKYQQALEERRAVIIEAVNKLIDEKKKVVDKTADRKCAAFEGKRNKVGKIVEYVEKMTNSLDQNIGAYSDYDLIEMEQDLLREVEQLDMLCAQTDGRVLFSPGQIDPIAIEKMVGEVNTDNTEIPTNEDTNIRVEKIRTFSISNDRIIAISPVTDKQAWIADSKSVLIKLLNTSDGVLDKRVLERKGAFITLSNSDHIVIHPSNNTIQRVMPDGRLSVIMDVSPLIPGLISPTQTDNFLLNLLNDKISYDILPSSRRLVQLVTISGNVLQTYEFKEDGTTRLFSHPNFATQNTNSDICVCNLTARNVGELIVLYRDGRVRFTYNQKRPGVFNFFPTGLACDSRSRIIIGDGYGFLHLLRQDGQLIKYIATDMTDLPIAIALRGNTLWVGLHNGGVDVYRYEQK